MLLPSAVVLVTPMDMEQIQADSVLMIWQKTIPSATRYMVQVATDSVMSNIFFQDSTLTDTTEFIKSLSSNVTYWWRVKAQNSAGWGQYSLKRRFILPATAVLPKHFEILSFGFSGSGHILRYALPARSYVSLKYYDPRGRILMSFVNQTQSAGYYSLALPISHWAKGTYIQVFKADNFIKMDRISIVK